MNHQNSTDQDEGDGLVAAFDSQDLFPELLRRLEAVFLRDGEDAKEAFAAAEVVVPNGGVVFLARRVQDVNLDFLAVENNLLRADGAIETPDEDRQEMKVCNRVLFQILLIPILADQRIIPKPFFRWLNNL